MTKKEDSRRTARRRLTAGFTLFELIVTITIFVLLTTAILIKNAQFKGSLQITNLAYEIALSIREAQTYGINVSAYDNGGTPDYSLAHGIHFATTNRTKFDLFVDKDKDGVFDSGEEEGTVFSLRGANTVTDLCTLSGPTCNRNSLDILFKRPDPEAKIHANGTGSVYTGGQIVITSPQGVSKTIQVLSTGQISVLP